MNSKVAEPPGRTVSIKYLSIHWVLMNWIQGTWQFIAADLVMDPKINHTFVHDLESAFYVVLWLSIKFLPNSWSASTRRFVMSQLFNPDAFPTVGSSSKRNWMRNAVSKLAILILRAMRLSIHCSTNSLRFSRVGI
jgi:hypothetical protein